MGLELVMLSQGPDGGTGAVPSVFGEADADDTAVIPPIIQ